MKILDKIKIKDTDYMCTQILFLKHITVYRIHEIFGDGKMFITEKDGNFQEITDENILKEIYKMIEVKDTDMIIG